LNKEETLVVKASERDSVLNEISAQIAKYERFDPEMAAELRVLRNDVKDIFNKGTDIGDEILEQLWFLDNSSMSVVEKMTRNYDRVITPNDFKLIASIMSEHMEARVPILKDFTKYFGRLAEDFLKNSKPSSSAFDWKTYLKTSIIGDYKKGFTLPNTVSRLLNLKSGEPLSEKLLKRLDFYDPQSNLAELLLGVKSAKYRKTGGKYMKVEYTGLSDLSMKKLLKGEVLAEHELASIKIGIANKLPKSWSTVPWVNFDGKVIEQSFTQVFEERLTYKDKDGNFVTNILNIPQKTEIDWKDIFLNKEGKIREIVDLNKAKTAYAVNANHSNDATIVKRFHLWGKKNNIPTSSIHDAFFTNIVDMTAAKKGLRKIYAESLRINPIIETLKEMRKRGLPKELHKQYLKEAIDKGLIPVSGKSKVGDKIIRNEDILTEADIMKVFVEDYDHDVSWYGIGP